PHGPLVPLLEEALAALPVEDGPLRARLLSRLATAIFWTPGSDERRRSLVRDAVEMAERLGDGGALAESLINKRTALIGPGDARERLVDASRVLRLAVDAGDRERELQAREARLYDLLELGDVASADVEIERIEELARALRQPRYLADAEMIRALRTLMDGNLEEGAELARRALERNEQVRPEIAITLYGSQMYWTVWREQGRFGELETGMKAIVDQVGAIAAARSGLAFVRSEQGKRAEARAELERIAADDFAGIRREVSWTAVMANLTEVCCFLGDLPRVRALYGELLPFAAMTVVVGSVPHACWGPIAHFLGMLAATMGDKETAEEHFERTLEMEARMRMPAMRARTQYEYGRMLIHADRPDDTGRAAELLAAALETARSLGLKVLEEKVGGLLSESPRRTTDVADARTDAPRGYARNLFRREGRYWTIAHEGHAFRLRNTKGLA
ncbi:MAG: hypothetical protein ACREQ9_04270, partial [Candidatus Binatia bacterium]